MWIFGTNVHDYCYYLAYSPAAITGYLSSIESLSGTNFKKWKEQISIILGVMDLDNALRVDAPAAFTAESSTEQKAAYEKWERSNRISLMIMKGSITTAIRGAIPDSDNAKLYLAHIEEQFQGSSKAHATTLITKMVTLKYSGSNGVREHILRMNDMASQLKGLDMEISEGFLVHFIMTSLPAQFGPFKINYNTQKEKWKMSELISMCVQEEERLKSEQPDSVHAAIFFSKNNKSSGGTKHIEIKYLVVRERIQNRIVSIQHISTIAMLADPMTKGLPPTLFREHVASMGLVDSLFLR
ncbi:hypothetical protein RJ639_020476 [Escallonia herrerae]|uniref:UBN2_2 domain-containing protein n=1 Tax=Escallonia herrerae TaxID=1293975 RepID=A0AA89AFW4_9ASTE|nr:hypothetical protein RJ639_020476 [Escallonia herrerae]